MKPNQNKQNEKHWLQVGICGIAEDKAFNDELNLPTKEIKRVKLAKFIRYKLNTNKIGFARLANVSPATVTKWLFTDAVPSMEMAKRLCRNFNLSLEEVDDLFEVA